MMSLRPRYSLLTLLVLTALVAVSVKLWYDPYEKPPLEWRWSKDKASLDYSTKQHLPDYEVELVGQSFDRTINIRSKQDGSIVCSIGRASGRTVFTRWKDILYIAEYYPISSGCEVVAVDLKSGKQLWKTELQGLGPVDHSKYYNLVNIETDGRIIIISGNEASGRYVEHLDSKTGKFLGNKQFDADYKSLMGN